MRGRVAGSAVAAAESAARTAGVSVRQLADLAHLKAVRNLYEGIWRPDGKTPPVTTELLRALTKAGSYVGGAFDGGELVGACVGFFAPPADKALHSHIAGVAAGMRGRNVGYALKLHQRAWALQHQVAEISWTFDPLVRRNAYFNIGKLAAAPTGYLPDFYGRMNDGINGSDETDRLLVTWRLTAPEVVLACAGQHPAPLTEGAVTGLDVSPHDGPVLGTLDGPTVLVAVPGDIEKLRATDPALAAAWRSALRDVLGGLLTDGARITGFDRAGRYVVERKNS
ncbi:GNAT family N-acetyltransferase [Streptomyces sp. BA2]|uniref:GNAT family N-acetyltransferase n=1 Tax=Streptomyces sp. BA2 TaxID=436595 RepID=UPI001325D62C|nr:GNAT family N-acetyltransferase [Streptomyces sp. BA2]MWA09662.1 GNAT family N-acetyltransferase [Streptomyces sp. BA2]